jgi:hypothetical protein
MTDVLSERYMIVDHVMKGIRHRIVGSAYRNLGESHYTLRLRILPGVAFYIVPKKGRTGWEYLIFTGKGKIKDGILRFFLQVGTGVIRTKENALELYLPDLRQVYYLKLEPDDFHFAMKSAA